MIYIANYNPKSAKHFGYSFLEFQDTFWSQDRLVAKTQPLILFLFLPIIYPPWFN